MAFGHRRRAAPGQRVRVGIELDPLREVVYGGSAKQLRDHQRDGVAAHPAGRRVHAEAAEWTRR
eukprot:scaffold5037_cov114-Isochrysis_galbana.AAC.10